MFSFNIIEHLTKDLSAAATYKAALEALEDRILAEDFSGAVQITHDLQDAINDSIDNINKLIDYVSDPFLRNGFTEISAEEWETIEQQFNGGDEITDAELNEMLGIKPTLLGDND